MTSNSSVKPPRPGSEAAAETKFGGCQSCGRQRRDAGGDLGRARGEFGAWKSPLHQAELFGARAVDHFGAQDQPAGEAGADQPRQPLGAAGAGDQAEADFRQAELGFVGRDAQVAGEREFEAAAERGAADLGDGHLRQGFDLGIDALDRGDVSIGPLGPVGGLEAGLHFLQVGAGAEHFLVGAQQQHLPVAPRPKRSISDERPTIHASLSAFTGAELISKVAIWSVTVVLIMAEPSFWRFVSCGHRRRPVSAGRHNGW